MSQTVAPVLAQSTQELESRINALEELLCNLPKLATEEVCIARAKAEGRHGLLIEQLQKYTDLSSCNPYQPECRNIPDIIEIMKKGHELFEVERCLFKIKEQRPMRKIDKDKCEQMLK